MPKIKWAYVVSFRHNGKLKDKFFPTEEEARKLTDRLKRNGEPYVLARAQPTSRLHQFYQRVLNIFRRPR